MKILFRAFCLTVLFFSLNDSPAQLKFALKIIEDLTSPDMHGRGYVNGGDSIAAEYIAEQYKKLGACKFESSYFQRFSFPVNTFPDTVVVRVDGKKLIPGVDFIVDPASPDAYGTYQVKYYRGATIFRADLTDISKNNILVADPAGIHDRDSLIEWNKAVHALGLIFPVIKLAENKLTWSVSREVQGQPVVEVLKSRWPGDAQVVELHINSQFIKKHPARNVVGYIKGNHKKKKKKYIVFTAHYDHLGRMGEEAYFPGANDNASGVAQMINLMKYYTEHPPEYTLVFIAFAGEEAGLLGSEYFTEKPFFSLEKIHFLVNLDIMGTGEDGITVVNGTRHKEEFDLLKKINEENDFLKEVKIRGEAANSDHYFFSRRGVPAFFIYTLGGSRAYHDVHDVMSGLRFYEFEDISRLLIAFVASF